MLESLISLWKYVSGFVFIRRASGFVFQYSPIDFRWTNQEYERTLCTGRLIEIFHRSQTCKLTITNYTNYFIIIILLQVYNFRCNLIYCDVVLLPVNSRPMKKKVYNWQFPLCSFGSLYSMFMPLSCMKWKVLTFFKAKA